MKVALLLICVVAYVVAAPDEACPTEDPEEAVFRPDKVYCAKYYECSNGHALPFICPRGTYWNNEENLCSDTVDCGSLKTTPAE
ncbi:hypothetical protein JTB14_036638 [Gonioctena quinquepunctata]|nr:hypothetical protein JTB14_036638 [Gonioctena quinquepunctata]